MLIGSIPKVCNKIINLTIENEPVQYVNSKKLLGVIIDSSLTWDVHLRIKIAACNLSPLYICSYYSSLLFCLFLITVQLCGAPLQSNGKMSSTFLPNF